MSQPPVVTSKKLIEVSLPLDAINAASAREKSIRHGHPSTLHLWWARRPLAAARAVLFAQLVDDPSAHPDEFPTPQTVEAERERLHNLMRQLVLWENTTNEAVLEPAREEIRKSWRRTCAANARHPQAAELFNPNVLPAFHDPFAGGGAIPLEAQRLGLEAWASDLNPVAVLINKAMIEIPPKFAGRPPINPEARSDKQLFAREWKGARGLAEDVRHYGAWMREQAEQRIGHLYPKIEVTAAMAADRPDLKPYVGRSLTVIAWLWARTVRSPNPAFAGVDVPLVANFAVSTKKGKEAWVDPVIRHEGDPRGSGYDFVVRVGGKPRVEETVNRQGGVCIMSGSPMPFDYIRAEGRAGRMGARLMAIVAEGDRGRVYLSPSAEQEKIALSATRFVPDDVPDTDLPEQALGFRVQAYGMVKHRHLFTDRQLVALTTFSDLVGEARERVLADARAAGLRDDGVGLEAGGTGALAYAEAVSVYLAFAVDKVSNISSSIASWMSDRGAFRETFARQAIPMVWDFAEANPFAKAGGSLETILDKSGMVIDYFPSRPDSYALQSDAMTQEESVGKFISTDPPYYDNIGYADLSDYFYVWLRRSLRSIYPSILSTISTPKDDELVATPYRHNSKPEAEAFFLQGMAKAMHQVASLGQQTAPITIYYAFKQTESDADGGSVSTGWETFLEAVVDSGLGLSGTWPMRTEGAGRILARDTNALASSILLVCRPRDPAAPTVNRRDFVNALRRALPAAIRDLQAGGIAPVDLAQASIGPGMAIFTRYAAVVDATGRALSVREALALINQTLDEVLAEQEGDFDEDTRFAVAWFEELGFGTGEFGRADVLARAKNTSVQGMVEAGILKSARGDVRLLTPLELAPDWDPAGDRRTNVWEMTHQLIRALEKGGETQAAELLAKLGPRAEAAKELAYRLYQISERKKRAADALSYNALVQSWQGMESGARQVVGKPTQGNLYSEE